MAFRDFPIAKELESPNEHCGSNPGVSLYPPVHVAFEPSNSIPRGK